MKGLKSSLLILVMLSLALPIQAAQVVHFPLKSLVQYSDVIVHGKLIDIRTVRCSDAPGRIERQVDIASLEFFKSNTKQKENKKLTFVMLGGRLGRYAQVVSGLPAIKKGDEVLLFLSIRRLDGALVLTGMAQGHYLVDTRAGGIKTAVSDRHGLQLFSRGPEGTLSKAPPNTARDEHLFESFIASIRSEVRRLK